jgi:uncharacterized protein (TIGR02270 family)
MNAVTPPPIDIVVQQHVDEVVHLRQVRTILVRAPHVRLLRLARIDERIAAHLDGVAVAGAHGARLCRQALDPPGTGAVFAATVQAIESREAARLHNLLEMAGGSPEARRGALSAFGWVSGSSLRGITKTLLESPDSWWQEVGVAACAMHRVDPGAALLRKMIDRAAVDPVLASRALRVAAGLACVDLRDECVGAMRSTATPAAALVAAQSAALLGDRDASVDVLRALSMSPGAERSPALAIWLKLAPREEAHAALKALLAEAPAVRTLTRAIGIAGDPYHVPWLISRMEDLALARLAGESFSLITGLDLAYLDLDLKPPEGIETGPNDDPNDANVALDEDDSLPWPAPHKIAAWWHRNGGRFSAGTRYFMGQSPTTAHCASVLTTGFQRQRRHAAEYLCLLKPGTPLFNTAAPAWRQQRLLGDK